MNAEKKAQKERIGRGVLGALLGALLGGAVIVFEDRTAGTFSPIFAVAATIAVFQGYRQLAGGLSKRGAVICVIILMAVIAGANQINCTMEVIETVDALRGWDFVEVFGAYEEIPEVREIQSRYQGICWYCICSACWAASRFWCGPSGSPGPGQRRSWRRFFWGRKRTRRRTRRSRSFRGRCTPSGRAG